MKINLFLAMLAYFVRSQIQCPTLDCLELNKINATVVEDEVCYHHDALIPN